MAGIHHAAEKGKSYNPIAEYERLTTIDPKNSFSSSSIRSIITGWHGCKKKKG
jgi:hypothetical protein